MIDRRSLLQGGAAAAALAALPARSQGATETLRVSVDTGHASGPLPHVWSECAGSDRAAMTLRESWRRDLDRWRSEAGLKRVRCHGIFADELGVWAPSIQNRGKLDAPNFQNIDQVYDGFVAHGVSPLIELSFMPKKLASGTAAFGFYGGNITPPTSPEAWGAFIRQFVVHLVDRYGVATVRTWPIEVWNEPNLPFFWTGKQQDYFDLYKATATAVKSVDPAIQVGGPATSGIAWIPEFMAYCAQNNAPVDFVSTHCYAGDNYRKMLGSDAILPVSDVVPAAVRRARQQIDASPLAGKPLWLTEWSSDSPAMIAHIIRESLPHLQLMSHWALSNSYEELGVFDFVLKDGDSGYGAMVDQIAKPAFNTYKLLHGLGTTRLAADGPALASRRADGSVAALVWNLAEVKQPSGIPGASASRFVSGSAKRVTVAFRGARAGQPVRVRFVDRDRGSPFPAWHAMGAPQYPTPAQLGTLRRAAEIAPPTHLRLDAARSLSFDLPPEGVALIELA